MRFLLPLLSLLFVPVVANATSYVYVPTPADLYDLDHHSAYTWRIDNLNLGGATITGASLTFTKIANWDNNANRLFIHLLDTAKFSGVRSFIDAAGVPVTNIADNFAGSLLASNPLVASGTGNTLLTSRSFSMTPTTFIYNFSAAQLMALQGYIANGNNLAFGFDPDCHYFNQGIKFAFATLSVPEGGSTVALLGLAFVGIEVARRKFCRDEQHKIRALVDRSIAE
jgi:hypothetical protein